MVHEINPDSRDYREYFDLIVAYNQTMHIEIAELLMNRFGEIPNGFSIGTVGSDARLEKSPGSLVEIILFTELDGRRGVRRRLESLVTKDNKTIFESHIEKKNIEKDSMCSSCIEFEEDKTVRVVSPNRVLDANFLYGNDIVYHRAKFKLAEELNGTKGNSIYRTVIDKVRHHRKVSKTGQQNFKRKELEHYNFNEGIAFYNPENNVWSFKQGPLRYVQFVLVRDIIRSIREGKGVKRMLYLPSNTVTKLNAMEVQGTLGISPEEMNDITDNYKFFLWQYHRSQALYRNGANVIQFDGKEAKERCEALARIGTHRLTKPL